MISLWNICNNEGLGKKSTKVMVREVYWKLRVLVGRYSVDWFIIFKRI